MEEEVAVMMQERTREKWIVVENFRIFDDGLWEKVEPNNQLSELVEISKLDYLGLDAVEELHIFKCSKPPVEITNMMIGAIGDDTHVYLAILVNDREQKAMLWPY
jgi:hypothetical protein